ncbi:MAG: radical SAM protein [Bacteroidetes bacterium]|nr:radical SAM protein [Bacteroidota bacterium]
MNNYNTILKNNYIFGPIKSRRLGVSLGINVLPIEKKICTFNCIYCECGWNNNDVCNAVPHELISYPKHEIIIAELEQNLIKINNTTKIDSITFSGNGEPTLHPLFPAIIYDTIELRNKYLPNTNISVLSNSTNLSNDAVVNALKKIDNAILKLDSANINTFENINLYNINNKKLDGTTKISIEKIIDGMKKFDGNFIFQIMFLRGKINGQIIDNTTEIEINGLINAIKKTNPKQIMIYPIDRITPADNLTKLDAHEMQKIANIIRNAGFNVLCV